MATIKTSELSGKALDYAVFLCLDDTLKQPEIGMIRSQFGYGKFNPSTNWVQCGPIIERESISIIRAEGEYCKHARGHVPLWAACAGVNSLQQVYGSQGDDWGASYQIDGDSVTGHTPLVAAMRCFVASKMGDSVEIPDELLKA